MYKKEVIKVRKDLAHSGKYTRIRKDVARKLFKEGRIIYLTPSNVVANDSSPWIKPYAINNRSGEDFDNLVNRYEDYNCNYELGYYTNFWIWIN
jgi:hypothetical protein